MQIALCAQSPDRVTAKYRTISSLRRGLQHNQAAQSLAHATPYVFLSEIETENHGPQSPIIQEKPAKQSPTHITCCLSYHHTNLLVQPLFIIHHPLFIIQKIPQSIRKG